MPGPRPSPARARRQHRRGEHRRGEDRTTTTTSTASATTWSARGVRIGHVHQDCALSPGQGASGATAGRPADSPLNVEHISIDGEPESLPSRQLRTQTSANGSGHSSHPTSAIRGAPPDPGPHLARRPAAATMPLGRPSRANQGHRGHGEGRRRTPPTDRGPPTTGTAPPPPPRALDMPHARGGRPGGPPTHPPRRRRRRRNDRSDPLGGDDVRGAVPPPAVATMGSPAQDSSRACESGRSTASRGARGAGSRRRRTPRGSYDARGIATQPSSKNTWVPVNPSSSARRRASVATPDSTMSGLG